MQIILGNVKHISYSFVGAVLRFLENAFLAYHQPEFCPLREWKIWLKKERMD